MERIKPDLGMDIPDLGMDKPGLFMEKVTTWSEKDKIRQAVLICEDYSLGLFPFAQIL
jgi:hypothetical protein